MDVGKRLVLTWKELSKNLASCQLTFNTRTISTEGSANKTTCFWLSLLFAVIGGFCLIVNYIKKGSLLISKEQLRQEITKIEGLYNANEGAIEQKNTANSLEILQATYSSPQKSIDVTAELKEMIQDDKLLYDGQHNDIKRDPHPGTHKRLVIAYRHKGQTHTKTLAEDDPIGLP